VVGIRLIN